MSSSEFKIDLKFFSTGIDEVISGMQKLKVATADTMSGQTALTKSTDSLGKSTEKAKPSLLQLGTSFGTVTAAGWSLYNSYDSLEKVKAASEKSNTRVKTSALAVQDAEQKLAEAIKKYGAGSKEAAEATAELAVKKEQLANASEIAAIKAEDVRESYAQFATTLPTMILSVVNAGVSFNKMVTEMGGIHKIAPQVTSALQAVGGGFKAILMNPIGLVLTAIATVFVLLATNAFGFRDAVNGLGKAIGDALPWLKDFLNLIGGAANWFLNLINPIGEASAATDTLGTSMTGATGPIGEVGTALTTLQQQAVDTGDATRLSVEDQIALYQQLGTEAETLQLALTAQLLLRTEAEQEHADKYAEFVDAMEDDDERLRDSLGLTKEEFDKLYEEWQKDIADFNKAFQDSVDKVVKNYELWASTGRAAQEELAQQYKDLNQELTDHYAKRNEGEKMDKEARKQWRDDLEIILGKISELTGSVSSMALQSAMMWKEFADTGVEMMDKVALEMLSGNFNAAIEHIQTAFDETPAKYKANFAPLAQIMQNPFIETDTKLQIMIAQWNKLNPYQSFIVAGVEYTRKNAELASSLDELTAAALRNTTEQSNMALKWEEFVASLDPAVKNLPIVKAAIDGVSGGAISAADAFKMVAAAGVEMSTVLGKDVTLSFDALKKTIVDLPGPTKAVFATINGEFVKVAEVADEELITGAKSVTKSMTTIETQSATLATAVDTALGVKTPAAIKKMVTDGNAEFTKMVTNMKTMRTGMEGESVSIVGAVVKLGKDIGTAWDATVKYLTDAWNGFLKLIGGGIPTAYAEEQNTSFLDTASANFQKIMQKKPATTTGGGGGADITAGMDAEKIKVITAAVTALQTALNTLSTTLGTLTPKITALGTAFTTLGTTVTTAVTTMNTQVGVFATTTGTQFTAVTAKLTALGVTFTTLSTTITTAMTAANTQVGVFVTTTGTQFTTLATTVTTAITSMNTQIGVFATNTGTQFTAVGTKATALGTTFTTMSATITTAVTKVNTQVGVMATTISTQTAAMTTKINSFASAMQSAMDKITKSMDTAKKSADALKKSIDALKDKTITITTRYVTSGSPAGQHGYQGIIGAPGNVGGVKVGEGFRPELITVTPLTRGTGNHYGATMGGGFGSPGGRGGGEVVNNITVVLDGRVIQRFVEKTALAGIGMQI